MTLSDLTRLIFAHVKVKGLDTKQDKLTTINAGDNISISEVGGVTKINASVDMSLSIPSSDKGVAGGVAELDSNGLVPTTQLPSYVDDVLEGTAQGVTETSAGTYFATGFILKGESDPAILEEGKTYVDITSNIQYRWTGTATNLVSMGSNLSLGETSSTAYAGNKGKQNADNITDLQTLTEKIQTDIAPVESGTTSSTAYAEDDLLLLNGTLYKAKTAIAVGDTLTVGTNIELTTIEEEINSAISVPPGGTLGQVLTKQSAEDGDADWEDIPDNLNITDAEIDTIADNIFNLDTSARIYGALWDGGESSVFTRTDDAADFPDPVPYVAGATTYGSPFDNISPWKDMKIVDDPQCGKLVQIPKYYYKWTKTGDALLLRVSMKPFTGSLVSPAHADRGDGKGERDVVYIGRYHCGANDYRSVSGVLPKANLTRAGFREAIHGLGSDVWQNDDALFWTVSMLYLVEFADWDSQKVIGEGTGDNTEPKVMGYTDSMPYHTGTTLSDRRTNGLGTQYRNIEGIWDNVYDWCDGVYFNDVDIYVIKNPALFSDTSGGTLTGTRPTDSGCIKAWSVPSTQGFEYALYPSEVVPNVHNYVGDYCANNDSGTVLFAHAGINAGRIYGMFYLDSTYSTTSKYTGIGSRLQKLP